MSQAVSRGILLGIVALTWGCAQNPANIPNMAPQESHPVAVPVAPKFAPNPIADAVPREAVKPAVRRCDFEMTLKSDETFGFGLAELNSEARIHLARDVVGPASQCSTIELISVTGYSDAIGARQINQTLSEKRAEAVKAFLVSRGLATEKISAAGEGPNQPVTRGCDMSMPHEKLIQCLAPDRRVVIVVKGLAR